MKNQETQVSDKEMVHFSFIDIVRKKRIKVHLKTSNGGILPLDEAVEKLFNVTKDKVYSESSNNYRDQIHPLCTHAAMTILQKTLGAGTVGLIAGNVDICGAIQLLSTTMFTMSLWLQEKGIKTSIEEESLTDLEINDYIQTSQTSSMLLYAVSIGLDVDETAAYLLSKGKTTDAILTKLGFDLVKVKSFVQKKEDSSNSTVN